MDNKEFKADIPPFPIMAATLTQIAKHYCMCVPSFKNAIEGMLYKIPRIDIKPNGEGERHRGRYCTLTPKEVGYIVDYVECVPDRSERD